MIRYLALDSTDTIVAPLAANLRATFVEGYKNLSKYPSDQPVIFRSMAQRKTVEACEKQKRPYLYIDTGYIGNMQKRKDWHRVVPSGMQHSTINWRCPSDRFERIAKTKPYLRFPGWKRNRSNILVVTPSEKPCKFYGINRDEWVEQTLSEIKKYTDRPIIVRDKTIRRERVGNGSIYHQLDEDNIFAVVTYNSIAATEAIGYGVPCFTLAPNAADYFCEKDLSKIENPKYLDPDLVNKWQNWLAYCQYLPSEMADGTTAKLIKEYNLS
jgi:hypothetical protein